MNRTAQFRDAARTVADTILVSARCDDDSVHWITAGATEPYKVAWRAAPDLYSGTAGIALFLLEAGHALDEARYRDMALSALSWCARVAAGGTDYSFYGGRLGIAFALLRAAEVTGDTRQTEKALDLARGYESYAETAFLNDLLGGVAGSIIGFLHLHRATGEAWTLEAVQALIRRLAATARWTSAGLCWDVRETDIKPLCGFSHGAAGVAFALLEASSYLDEPLYRTLALEAIRQENASYDFEAGTWPDFRKLPRRPEPVLDETAMSDDVLLQPNHMDAWCHGAPGIAFSRLRAIELLGSEWRDDALRAIARTRATIDQAAASSFTLCHGACGNAMAFLEARRVLGDACYQRWAEEVGERAIAHHEAHGYFASGYFGFGVREEPSLMMGSAGVGYFFLQLIGNPVNVLSPAIRGNGGRTAEHARSDALMRRLARGLAPRSLAAISARAPEECETFFADWHDRNDVLAFIAREASNADAAEQFTLESEKLTMRETCPSFALVTIARLRAKRDAVVPGPEQIENCRFQLAPFSRVWRANSESESPRLLRIMHADVEEIELTELSAAILEAFSAPATVASAMRSIEKTLETPSHATIAALHAAVSEQVANLVRAGFLVVGSSDPTT